MDDDRRRLLAGSIFAYCGIDQLAEQITASAVRFDRIYVERLGSRYRWSLVHRGGPYPLLRELAQLLEVSYHSLILPFDTVDGWTIVWAPELGTAPDSWSFIEPASNVVANRERILEVTRQ